MFKLVRNPLTDDPQDPSGGKPKGGKHAKRSASRGRGKRRNIGRVGGAIEEAYERVEKMGEDDEEDEEDEDKEEEFPITEWGAVLPFFERYPELFIAPLGNEPETCLAEGISVARDQG